MKHLFGPERPDVVSEAWPGQFTAEPWLESVFTLPRVISVITTRKENGASNACPHLSGMLIGGGTEYSSLITVGLDGHTYTNIMREKEWCINLTSSSMEAKWRKTIECNGPENDELSDAGFTIEQGETVKAPRIGECLVNLECRLEWDHSLYEGSKTHLLCGRITAVAVHESLVSCGTEESIRAMDLPYCVLDQINPLTGERLSPYTLLSMLPNELHPY